MTLTLPEFIAKNSPRIEAALEDHLPVSFQRCGETYNEAVRYAVFPGGKRWRPMLTLIGATAVGGEVDDALPAAAAMEYLHTSSLILDDLPAMDDADLRRGRPALHLVYGESLALLAALALLNQSYSLLGKACERAGGPARTGRLVQEAVECIGANGMIGGQVAELECRGSLPGAPGLANRNLKTTALTRLMMVAGAAAAGATESQLSALSRYGECLGAAYQISDDLLDELGESWRAGKPVRQDQRHLRPSSVAELGVEGAARLAASLIQEAKDAVKERFAGRPEVYLLSDAAELIIGGVCQVDFEADLVA
jgi:geranylgeranyl diphosphate synthase, type II